MPKCFEWPVRVYWEDTDAGGVVYHAQYLAFMERARSEWLRSLGFSQQALRTEHGGMFVVSQAQLQYLHPARLDDELWITAQVSEKGRAALTIEQQALLKPQQAGAAPTLLCQGQVRVGWVDGASLRPARIPNFVLETFA